MDKWSMVTYIALWITIVAQYLTIRDLRKQIENEQKWSEYWRISWLRERNRRWWKERANDDEPSRRITKDV